MTLPSFEKIEIGAALPAFTTEPISRLTLALYAGASGDHNPIHVDLDFAKDRAGMEDVFAHGMLSMAYLGRLLTNWAPQAALRSFQVRFASITQVGDSVTCSGTVLEKMAQGGARCVRVQVSAVNQAGDVKLSGEAVFALA